MVIKNFNSIKDNEIGQIFTPSYIAEFMVKNIILFIKKSGKDPHKLRVLEPSVGEGVFLKFLLNYNFCEINAYEVDKNLKKNLLNSYPNIDFKFENFLGSDPNEKFDLIIGNPPYLGQNYNAKIFQEYVKKYPFCAKFFVGNMDLFYFFIHLSIEKLNPGGFLSFITTNYWITKSKKTGIKFLKPHLLEECFLLQYIDLSHLKPFDGAKGQHNCIFILQKKTKEEKIQKINKNIEIIQLTGNEESNQKNKSYNEVVFKELISGTHSNKIKRFTSALTHNDLKKDGSWNLIYPMEVQKVVAKIEDYCKINGKISLLKDYFLIRNGLILIKDSIFILNEGRELKIEDDNFFIKLNGKFLKLSEKEKKKLKIIYKSKSIKQYSYTYNRDQQYLVYFNKHEFNSPLLNERNRWYKENYPILTEYICQYEKELRNILINAKENPDDYFFPRRGSFIRKFDKRNIEKLIDLEPLYDKGKKIFFKFISNKNIFGYSEDSYYATSDTYFLWPIKSNKNLNYLFILAYLNSKLVNFLFKAKNIYIKRSKTKLEYGLPIPNLKKFNSIKETLLIEFITLLTSYLIKKSNSNCEISSVIMNNILNFLKKFSYMNEVNKLKIIRALKNEDQFFIQHTLDKIIFQLFDLDENQVDSLIMKYYK
ncbi:MAG: Eco57I restriction-modification methylase domain-containing protein [Candidatus Hermodarchaeota archaeon]